jgi:DNA-binding transcriptional ArsR family regulator
LRRPYGARHTEPIGALSLDLDATFFALSDPQRRGILERLSGGPASLSQLAEPSGLTLNGIKKHVGILEVAGLVQTEKVGRVRECRLGPASSLGEAGEWIEAHRRAWASRLDRFGRFVEDAQ